MKRKTWTLLPTRGPLVCWLTPLCVGLGWLPRERRKYLQKVFSIHNSPPGREQGHIGLLRLKTSPSNEMRLGKGKWGSWTLV